MQPEGGWRWILGVTALTALAWSPVRDCGWFWDDRGTFLTNAWLLGPDFFSQSLRPHLGHWQPLSWWSLRLDRALWTDLAGVPAPRAHLLSNVLFHAGSAAALTALLLEVLRLRARATSSQTRGAAAAIGALAWALHPARVESVAWATERRDVLATLLALLGLLAWLTWRVSMQPRGAPAQDDDHGRSTPPRPTALLVAVVCFSLSALAKAWVVALPGALLGLEIGLFGVAALRDSLRRSAMWLGLAIPVAVIAALAQHSAGATADGGLGGVARVVGAGHNLLTYLGLTALPLALAPLHPLVPGTALDATHVAGLVGAVAMSVLLVLRAARPTPSPQLLALLGGWIGFVAWLAPVLGLMQSGVQAVAERYLILAHVPLVILAVEPLARWLQQRRVAAIGLTLLVVLAWSGRMLAWQQVWIAGPEALWTAAIAAEPRSVHARVNRAALRLARDAPVGDDLTIALALAPRDATAWKVEAEVLRRAGQPAAALRALRRAAQLAPGDTAVQCNLGAALASQGQPVEAMALLDAAIASRDDPACRLNRAVLLVQTGRRQAATVDVDAALAMLPRDHPEHSRAVGMSRALRR